MNSGIPDPEPYPANDLAALFGPAGPLAASLDNFAPRPEQLAMAEAVAASIRDSDHLVVEAGTGTGKTLAYLVPLLLAGQRGVVSTGTRTLQDQLFHRDLPMLCAALGRPSRVRLLKGRANYLCLYRLDQLAHAGQLPAGAAASELQEIKRWSQATTSGDLAELQGIGELTPVVRQITSTAENCLGADCAFLSDCHVARARQAAREADIVVVNHHLLMADLTMREEGFGQLLPGAETVIVDEAHNFPEVAQNFLNVALASGQLVDLAADIRTEALEGGGWSTDLDAAVSRLQNVVRQVRLSLGDSEQHLEWEAAGADFSARFRELGDTLFALNDELEAIQDLSMGLERCRERASSLAGLADDLLGTPSDEALRWVRVTPRGFVANLTPLDTSSQIQALLQSQAANWVFTSATLAVGEDFAHFTDRIGLPDMQTRQVPSPFDFGRIARLYLPKNLPEPSAANFTEQMIAAARPVLDATRGRAFLLFTSHRALRRAAEILREDADFDYPLLVQGESPRSRLLDRFSELPDGVLLGTSTFWEGVDIRGHGLVLVVIDRLPFASPGDPLLAARLQAIREHGGNPFRDFQLPQAVLSLKQGAGRLIRDYSDYGVVMICDPRLQTKSYGRVFRKSLPPMPVLHEQADVVAFLQEQEAMA